MRLLRNIRHFLVKLEWPLIEDIAVQEATALNWQSTKPCYRCQEAIVSDARFCDKCGACQARTDPFLHLDTNQIFALSYGRARLSANPLKAYTKARQDTEGIKMKRMTGKL